MQRARRPRLVDPGYLTWLRKQRCACGCLQPGPCDAAHLRAGNIGYDKPSTGMGRKPDDKWALPLKHSHHMRQHAHGAELEWWAAHGIHDPFALCLQYYKRYGGTGGEPKPRRTTIKPRLPKEQRRKIQSAPMRSIAERTIPSRQFPRRSKP